MVECVMAVDSDDALEIASDEEIEEITSGSSSDADEEAYCWIRQKVLMFPVSLASSLISINHHPECAT